MLVRGFQNFAGKTVIGAGGRCAILPAFLLLGGCVSREAPSFPLCGAYFPAWMFCSLFGIGVALGLRALFLYIGLDAILSFRLFTYVALGLIAGLVLWLLVFGP
ncbi:YtcA family lipoprotein [Acetobacter vaccinii]|uniref:Uncharacterized protein YtcA n=1 Tax=Acetobacter vaccinii TaxID=2592655 RepID=A0A5C1YKP0_9PROT|nr:YtcA family lipoprotein [Acetobacter vaccinii]QEO16816.1 hypothetical protein FLP30_02805 [Acetobacter vaccinii]